jgi:hypothetical protein
MQKTMRVCTKLSCQPVNTNSSLMNIAPKTRQTSILVSVETYGERLVDLVSCGGYPIIGECRGYCCCGDILYVVLMATATLRASWLRQIAVLGQSVAKRLTAMVKSKVACVFPSFPPSRLVSYAFSFSLYFYFSPRLFIFYRPRARLFCSFLTF